MNTSTLAATLSALTPGKMNGAKARPSTSAASSAASRRLRGRSLERRRDGMVVLSAVRDRVDTLRAPQQHGHHQENARKLRQRRQQEGGGVVHQADEQGANQRAGGRAEA